ncbi:MAG: FHA domain-containing protein, partial [Planctomycetota bacterium]|nr:FHA domain-containing protein [Planctomycetota bacterium]
MGSYVLRGAGEEYRLPQGQVAIGSDAACEISLREGTVLPTHAVIVSEEGRVIVRPAGEGALVRVNGLPISGATPLRPGDALTIGGLTLTLEERDGGGRGLLRRPYVRYPLLAAAAAAGLAALLTGTLYVLVDEQKARSVIIEAAEAALKREVSIEDVRISLPSARLVLRGVRVRNREGMGSGQHLLYAPIVTARLDAADLLFSFGGRLRCVGLTVESPELTIERHVREDGDAYTNVDDLLEIYGSGSAIRFPMDIGLSGPKAVLEVAGGTVVLRDHIRNGPDVRISGVNLRIASSEVSGETVLTALGPARGGEGERESARPGKIVVSSTAALLDRSGRLDPGRIPEAPIDVSVHGLDMEPFMRFFGVRLPRLRRLSTGEDARPGADSRIEVMLGQSVSGKCRIAREPAGEMRLTGEFHVESLLATIRPDGLAVGGMPTDVGMDIQWDASRKTVSLNRVRVECPSAGLRLDVSGRMREGTRFLEPLKIALDADIGLLAATPLFAEIGLAGRAGGRLSSAFTLAGDAYDFDLDAALKISEGWVRSSPGPEGGRIPLPLESDVRASVVLAPGAAAGKTGPREIRGRWSARSRSLVWDADLSARNLNVPASSSIRAGFSLDVDGEMFAAEFGPFLRLFSLPSFREKVHLKGNATGSRDAIEASFDGTIERQGGRDPMPIGIRGRAKRIARDGGSLGWEFDLEAGGRNRGMKAATAGIATEWPGGKIELDLKSIEAAADIAALRERLSDYRSLVEIPAALKSGFIRIEGGRLRGTSAPMGERKGNPRDFDFAFEGRVAGRDIVLSLPRNDSWTESSPSWDVQMRYLMKPAPVGREPVEIADIPRFRGRGEAGTLEGALRHVDVAEIRRLYEASRPPRPRALARRVEVRGAVANGAVKFLDAIFGLPAWMPAEARGEIDLEADMEADAVTVRKFRADFGPFRNASLEARLTGGMRLLEMLAPPAKRGGEAAASPGGGVGAGGAAGGGAGAAGPEGLQGLLPILRGIEGTVNFRGETDTKELLNLARALPDPLLEAIAGEASRATIRAEGLAAAGIATFSLRAESDGKQARVDLSADAAGADISVPRGAFPVLPAGFPDTLRKPRGEPLSLRMGIERNLAARADEDAWRGNLLMELPGDPDQPVRLDVQGIRTDAAATRLEFNATLAPIPSRLPCRWLLGPGRADGLRTAGNISIGCSYSGDPRRLPDLDPKAGRFSLNAIIPVEIAWGDNKGGWKLAADIRLAATNVSALLEKAVLTLSAASPASGKTSILATADFKDTLLSSPRKDASILSTLAGGPGRFRLRAAFDSLDAGGLRSAIAGLIGAVTKGEPQRAPVPAFAVPQGLSGEIAISIGDFALGPFRARGLTGAGKSNGPAVLLERLSGRTAWGTLFSGSAALNLPGAEGGTGYSFDLHFGEFPLNDAASNLLSWRDAVSGRGELWLKICAGGPDIRSLRAWNGSLRLRLASPALGAYDRVPALAALVESARPLGFSRGYLEFADSDATLAISSGRLDLSGFRLEGKGASTGTT